LPDICQPLVRQNAGYLSLESGQDSCHRPVRLIVTKQEQTYAGNHEAIIDEATWQSVQETLRRNRHNQYLRTQAKEPSLLAGLLFDEAGHPLSPTHTRKKSRRYRYYVNQALVQFKQTPADAVTRIPAQTLESLVQRDVVWLLTDPVRLLGALASLKLTATDQQALLQRAEELATAWSTRETPQRIGHLTAMVERITLSRATVTIRYSVPGIANALLAHAKHRGDQVHESRIAVALKRCGVETKLVVEQSASQENLKPHADSLRAIHEAVKKGLSWNQALIRGEAESVKALAEANQISDRYVSQAIRLAFLSPSIIQRIFKGDIPHDLTLGKLKAQIPLNWSAQESLFS
jgi:site-specific DNA recombinase